MKGFERNIRRKLRRHSTPVDTDALWESIQGDIPSRKEDKGRRLLLLWFLLAGSLGLGIGWGGIAWMGGSTRAAAAATASPQQDSPALAWDTPSLYHPLLQGQGTYMYQVPQKTAPASPAATLREGMDIFNHNEISPLQLPSIPYLEKQGGAFDGRKPEGLGTDIPKAIKKAGEATPAYLEMPPQFAELLPDVGQEELEPPSPPEAETQGKEELGQKTRFALGVTQSHAYTGSRLDSKEKSLDYYTQKRKETEEHLHTLGVGLAFTTRFANGLQLRTGLEYTQVRQQFHYQKRGRNTTAMVSGSELERSYTSLYSATPMSTGTAQAPHTPSSTSLEVDARHQHRYHLLDVPLVVGYAHGLPKCALVVEGGLYYNLRTYTQGYIMQTDGEYGRQSEQIPAVFRKRHGFSTYAGLSLEFPLSQRMQLGMGGHFRYTPFSITTGEHPTSQRLMSAGGHLGLFFQL